jgi:calcineurin-like phosphoesterase
VLNLQGRVSSHRRPVQGGDELVGELRKQTPIADFHAETTSRSRRWALLDGRVTAIVHHTHVQTADEHIMPGGTAHCDAGMTGPHDSRLSAGHEGVASVSPALPEKFTVADGDVRLAAVLVTADAETGRAEKIQRFMISMDEGATPSLAAFKD